MGKPVFRHFRRGQKPSAKEYNKLVDYVAAMASSIRVNSFLSSEGVHTRRAPFSKFEVKIFEVQSAAAGDGIYNCYEQKLDSTEWTDTTGNPKFDDKDTTEVEVLNLGEFNPRVVYTSALAKYDLITAFSLLDDENEKRWIGLPLISGSMVRRAKTTEAAPASDHINCNLYNPTPAEITSGLGSNIEVYCAMCGTTTLNTAVPRLEDNDDIFVTCIQGKWWCTTVFQKACDSDCVCT